MAGVTSTEVYQHLAWKLCKQQHSVRLPALSAQAENTGIMVNAMDQCVLSITGVNWSVQRT